MMVVIIKDERYSRVLIVFLIVCILKSFFVFFIGFNVDKLGFNVFVVSMKLVCNNVGNVEYIK